MLYGRRVGPRLVIHVGHGQLYPVLEETNICGWSHSGLTEMAILVNSGAPSAIAYPYSMLTSAHHRQGQSLKKTGRLYHRALSMAATVMVALTILTVVTLDRSTLLMLQRTRL